MRSLKRIARLVVLYVSVAILTGMVATIAILLASLLTPVANAQAGAIDYKESITGPVIGRSVTDSDSITFGSDGIRGNWAVISNCAWKVYPRPPKEGEEGYLDMTSPGWRAYSNVYQQVSLCRWILAAYAAGWRDSGTKEPNPFPPVPNTVPGDFQELAK